MIDELLAIRNYEDDFDGEGSIAPPVQIVDAALTFSNQLGKHKIPSPDRVTATFNQTVVFEWNFPNFYHSLEFILPTMAEAIWIPKDATEALIKKVYIFDQHNLMLVSPHQEIKVLSGNIDA